MSLKVTDKELVRYHILPCRDNEPQHEQSPKCWCDPYLDDREEDETKSVEIWVHNLTQ